jgi:hypothetical protein
LKVPLASVTVKLEPPEGVAHTVALTGLLTPGSPAGRLLFKITLPVILASSVVGAPGHLSFGVKAPLELNVTLAPLAHVTVSVPEGLRENVVNVPLPPVSGFAPLLQPPRLTVEPVFPLRELHTAAFAWTPLADAAPGRANTAAQTKGSVRAGTTRRRIEREKVRCMRFPLI